MATFYVDLSKTTNGAGGSWGDAFNTFTSLPAMSGGDIVEIRGGIMPSIYTLASSGSVGNPIIFRGDPTASELQTIYLATEGINNIVLSSRSNIVWENLKVEGNLSWTNQSTVAFVLGGAMSNIIFRNVHCRAARVEVSPGFAITNVQFLNSSITDCRSDGFRSFSSIATYVHSNFLFDNCILSRNGLAQGANGAGISFLVQDTHVNCNIDNIIIRNCIIEDNFRAGIAINGTGISWSTIIAAGNTTPPDQRYRGIVIENNQIRRNGGAGITILGGKGSSENNVNIKNNIVEDCGRNTTIGGIWTGGCLNTIIEYNTIRRSISNGTIVGDGQGIFDDQWNDGAIVRYNVIENNIFQPFNPFYTAYGIGVFRCSNSKHYGNIILGCRQGYFIGYVTGATAPVMSGIVIENNTIINSTNFVFSINAATPAAALTIRNNFVLNAAQDVEAQSGTAGNQTMGTNVAVGVPTKYTGNNVPVNAFDHTQPTTIYTGNGVPTAGSMLLTSGSVSTFLRDINGILGKSYIGAYSTTAVAAERGVR